MSAILLQLQPLSLPDDLRWKYYGIAALSALLILILAAWGSYNRWEQRRELRRIREAVERRGTAH